MKTHKSRDFYPIIDTKLDIIYIGIVRLHIQLNFEVCRSHKNGNNFLQNFKNLIKVVIFIGDKLGIKLYQKYIYIIQYLSYMNSIETEILSFKFFTACKRRIDTK